MGANALFTAVSGLNANQTYLGVIGNNIANSNTIGFKSSDPIFQNLVSQTLSGVSSSQEGLGTSVYSIQQQFGQGALETTSNPLNMAVDGSGFFIVQSPNGSTYYTRNGQFSENAQGQIVDSTDRTSFRDIL
jgi:fagellar hook-basal body proteins